MDNIKHDGPLSSAGPDIHTVKRTDKKEMKKILNSIVYEDITNIIISFLQCNNCKNMDTCICFECDKETCRNCCILYTKYFTKSDMVCITCLFDVCKRLCLF